jgi:hypothetical protein
MLPVVSWAGRLIGALSMGKSIVLITAGESTGNTVRACDSQGDRRTGPEVHTGQVASPLARLGNGEADRCSSELNQRCT